MPHPKMHECKGCHSEFEPATQDDVFCADCRARLCKECRNAVPNDPKHIICADCAEKKELCPTCGESLSSDRPGEPYTLCGDCDGGTERDPAVGDAWSGGFAENH